MGTLIDLTGKCFNRLQVLERDFNKYTNRKIYWICKCDCGNIISARGQDLRNGRIQSCGCLSRENITKRNMKDLAGQKFGKLTAIQIVGKNNHANFLWECKCDCGKTCMVASSSLISGNTQSCGCISSNGENIIASIFDEYNIQYQRQYSFNDLTGDDGITRLRFDFAIFNQDKTIKCLIEFQGEQHFIPFKNDTEETFTKRQRYDEKKRLYCKENNILLIEIPYQDRFIINWNYLKLRLSL